MIDLWINLHQGIKLVPQKLVFSTARFQSEKKLPFAKNNYKDSLTEKKRRKQ